MALLASLVLGCSSAAAVRADFAQAEDAGDHSGAEQILRSGLEKHPDDLDLLLAASGFYLRAEPREHYKPRLALHYAMRATRVTRANDPRATALLKRATFATGGIAAGDDEAAALLRRALDRVGEFDAQPVGLRPFDPDLLGGTGAEVREQLRRWKARDAGGSPCPEKLALVPEGTWDLGRSATVPGFCIEERPATTPALRLEPGAWPVHCGRWGLRACTEDELAVACGPLRAVLPQHAGCTDSRFVRCCADLAGDSTIQ